MLAEEGDRGRKKQEIRDFLDLKESDGMRIVPLFNTKGETGSFISEFCLAVIPIDIETPKFEFAVLGNEIGSANNKYYRKIFEMNLNFKHEDLGNIDDLMKKITEAVAAKRPIFAINFGFYIETQSPMACLHTLEGFPVDGVLKIFRRIAEMQLFGHEWRSENL